MAEQEFTTEELESEEWRDVAEWEGLYSVSSLGRVYSHRTDRVLKPGCGKGYDTYPRVLLCKRPIRKTVRVHLLVAHAFLGPCPHGYEVDHGEGGKRDSRLSNLEYVTSSENRKRDFIRGKSDHHGSRHPTAKLSDDAVRTIRARRAVGEKLSVLAGDFDVAETTICDIARRRTWNHIS